MTNLLVVDDESATRRLVAYTLKSLRVDVTGAETGAEAMKLAAEGDFKMILLDINLPMTDGFTLLTMLRALPNLDGVPIIMFTARSNPKDEMRASELGANGFLYKPFTTAELRTLVTNYLSKATTQETMPIRPETALEPRLGTPLGTSAAVLTPTAPTPSDLPTVEIVPIAAPAASSLPAVEIAPISVPATPQPPTAPIAEVPSVASSVPVAEPAVISVPTAPLSEVPPAAEPPPTAPLTPEPPKADPPSEAAAP